MTWIRCHIPPELWKKYDDGEWHLVETTGIQTWIDGEEIIVSTKVSDDEII